MNEHGIPAPLFRADGKPSITATLVIVSSFVVLLSLLNSAAAIFKGVDVTNALYWNGLCIGAYLGRKVTGDGKKIEITSEDKKEE